MKKYLVIVITILTIGLILTCHALLKERSERKRYQNNFIELTTENEAYKTKEGKWAIDARMLELKASELEQYCSEQTETIKALGVKVRRLESVSTIGIRTEVEVSAPIRDTVIMKDTVEVLAGSFHWSDSWLSIDGLIHDGIVDCRVESVDSLTQVLYRVPRRFLFIKYGTKEVRQTIISSNPHSRLIYSEYIKLRR